MTSPSTRSASAAQTSSATRLWGLDSPTMRIDAAHLVIGAEGTVDIPLPAYLIEHEQGLVLFDTGMHPDVCEDPRLVFGDRPESTMITGTAEQRLDNQLRMLGYDTTDVTHVVLSHTHTDHAGGLFMFPHAKFFIGPGEYDYARNPPASSAHLVMHQDILRAEIQNFDWTTIDSPVYDLFGDGAIQLHHFPGHTPGELSTLVRLPSQNIMLTADTVHLREAVDWREADPSDWNHEVGRESIDRMLAVTEQEQARLWISHDERDWADFGGPRTELK